MVIRQIFGLAKLCFVWALSDFVILCCKDKDEELHEASFVGQGRQSFILSALSNSFKMSNAL